MTGPYYDWAEYDKVNYYYDCLLWNVLVSKSTYRSIFWNVTSLIISVFITIVERIAVSSR